MFFDRAGGVNYQVQDWVVIWAEFGGILIRVLVEIPELRQSRLT